MNERGYVCRQIRLKFKLKEWTWLCRLDRTEYNRRLFSMLLLNECGWLNAVEWVWLNECDWMNPFEWMWLKERGWPNVIEWMWLNECVLMSVVKECVEVYWMNVLNECMYRMSVFKAGWGYKCKEWISSWLLWLDRIENILDWSVRLSKRPELANKRMIVMSVWWILARTTRWLFLPRWKLTNECAAVKLMES